jgi:hypothetical protein
MLEDSYVSRSREAAAFSGLSSICSSTAAPAGSSSPPRIPATEDVFASIIKCLIEMSKCDDLDLLSARGTQPLNESEIQREIDYAIHCADDDYAKDAQRRAAFYEEQREQRMLAALAMSSFIAIAFRPVARRNCSRQRRRSSSQRRSASASSSGSSDGDGGSDPPARSPVRPPAVRTPKHHLFNRPLLLRGCALVCLGGAQ